MIVRRRRVLVSVAALALTVLWLLHREDDLASWLPTAKSDRQHQPASQVQTDTFRWNDVPVQNPLKSYRAIPPIQHLKRPQIQHQFAPESAAERKVRLDRRAAVKESFTRCYTSYRQRAWLKDELKPKSGQSRDTFGGWAATLVDSLDTLAIMGMTSELDEAMEATRAINFSRSSSSVINVFETNIRYLGGFLSAYDLTGSKIMLEKALEVGEMLIVTFDTPNHLPVPYWHWEQVAKGATQEASENMVIAQLGSFSMEFTRLSQITGDMRWYDAMARITDLFYKQRKKTTIPGLWPVSINARTQDLSHGSVYTLGAMADSLYEYFPKMYALLGGVEDVYRTLYQDSMAAAIKYLFFRPMVPNSLDILVAGNAHAYTGVDINLDSEGQHLGCFTGGMLALGGKLFGQPAHVEVGRRLTDGCVWAYNASASGIMPETFHLIACKSVKDQDCQWDDQVWKDAVRKRYAGDFTGDKSDDVEMAAVIAQHRLQPGFLSYGDRSYILRPEALESVFILYRITGDKALQDAAWQMYQAIEKLTRTKYGNAALIDITLPPEEVTQKDEMESFWMAETLKYLYLTFSETDLISLDEWVLNTEAHPFKMHK